MNREIALPYDCIVRDEMGKVNHPKYPDSWYRHIVRDTPPGRLPADAGRVLHVRPRRSHLAIARTRHYRIAGCAGFDWLLIDGEHSPNDLRSILQQAQVVDTLTQAIADVGYVAAPQEDYTQGLSKLQPFLTTS